MTSAWTYDATGRPVSLVHEGHASTFHHDAVGRETGRRLDNGLALDETWDPVGRLTGMVLTAPDATPNDRRSYAYRADHHLLSLAEPDGTTEFALDPGGRVTRLTARARSES